MASRSVFEIAGQHANTPPVCEDCGIAFVKPSQIRAKTFKGNGLCRGCVALRFLGPPDYDYE